MYETKTVDSVHIEEVTITFICESYPEKMMRHLKDERKFLIKNIEAGIYYVLGDIIPIQLIVQKELSPQHNLWLRSLTDKLENQEDTRRLVEAYKGKGRNPLYEAVMDIVVRANSKKFEEDKTMCEALREIMSDMIEEELEEEFEKGKRYAEKRVNDLIGKLLELGRNDDISKAVKDPEYQKRLFEEFGL